MRIAISLLLGLLVLSSGVPGQSANPSGVAATPASKNDDWVRRLGDSGWSVQGSVGAIWLSQRTEPTSWLTAQFSKGPVYLVLVDLRCSASLMLNATAKEKVKSRADAESVTRKLGSNLSAELRQSRPYSEALAYVAAATGNGEAEARRAIQEWIETIDWPTVAVVNDDEFHTEQFRQIASVPPLQILVKRSTASLSGELYGLAAVEIRTPEKP